MAFWGVEVKPDKPITHYWLRASGRLRISQATLGAPRNGTESEIVKKAITVQCNVGRKSPVLLCALIPTKTESCHLDLEFEEADDVVFSVIGPRSVYLTGYYVQRAKPLDPHSDTETYGVDIDNTQTEGSSYFSDDNKYEDSFINDGELQFSPQPFVNDGGMDEPNESDKGEDKKCLRRKHKKKYRVVDSDSVPDTFEDEDVDDCPLSAIKGKSTLDKIISDTEEKGMDEPSESDKVEDKNCLRRQHTKKYRVVDSDSVPDIFEDEDVDDCPLSAIKSISPMDKTISDTEEKGGGKKCLRRQHTKKYRVVDSDSVPDTFEDEDEDDCPLSTIKSKSALDKTILDTGEKNTGENIPQVLMEMGDDLKDDDAGGIESNEKVDKLEINGKPEGMIKLSLNEERTEVEENTEVVGEKNDLPNEVKTIEEMHFPNETNGEDIIFNESLPISTWKDQMQSLDIAKPKRPKKKRGKHNKEHKDDGVNMEDKEHENIAQALMEMGDGLKDDGVCGIESNEKVDQLDINGNPEGMVKLSVNEERAEVEEEAEVVGEKNDLPKEVETSENTHAPNETGGEVLVFNKSLPMSTLKDQTQPLDIAKPRRKRKKLSKEDKDHSVNLEDKEHAIEASANMDVDVNSTEGQKSKKRRNILQLEGSEQGLHAKDLKKDLPVANTEENQEHLGLDEIITDEIAPESHGIPEEFNNSVLLLTHADTIKEDLPAESGEENQERQTDNGGQPEKKTKRRKKIPGKGDSKMDSTDMEYTKEAIVNDAEPIITRILPSGMVIEQLASGPPNGKVAALGKKLKICYTATLKETGHVYDKSSCQFKLGDENFLQGWNIGIDGMRVGDKRRLIIPPSLGFGDEGVEDVPPNSWVVYDVELLRVRK